MGSKTRVEKTRGSGTLTEAGYKGRIKSLLRKGSRFWKPMVEVKMEARMGEKHINPDTGRLCFFMLCAHCNEGFPEKQIQMDHIDPVVDPHVGFVSWDVYIERLYCEKENFQALCKPCHQIKTNAEKAVAKERKNND